MSKTAFDAKAVYRAYKEQRSSEVVHALRRLKDLGVYVDGLMRHLDREVAEKLEKSFGTSAEPPTRDPTS